ncbi:DoxX family membrane protein [Flavobacterium sp. GA093]|uniref:DoxX family membrane protein n=1 Tax=Flavobacterium hydrocarbonoxydans TaxID=2683249 RepID=A0A6I4NSB5_9FLAO|nr:DoxX family membrane protein [Flavobacterium hydrocarbonoxydans]MWB94559.1 DoxX family membrane protein [Flavobacterium hydrocarbonoxydans]
MNLPWHLYLMALLYILAGFNHFRNPKMYIKIIPSYFSNPKLLNILSGAAEIILGILLMLSFTTHFAAWGIIALLIAVFPANLFMYQDKKASFGLPKWVLLLRLPLQLLLIVWAYQYTF